MLNITPLSAMALANSDAVMPSPAMSKLTMLVCVSVHVHRNAIDLAQPSARHLAVAWSSTRRSTIFPAPLCRQRPALGLSHPAASIFLFRRARSTNSASPASIEPTGAESPLDRQNITESTCLVICVTGTFR